MSTTKSFAGVSYALPNNLEPRGWGVDTSLFLQAIADNAIPKTGGSYTLSAELNLGATFGVLGAYWKSAGSNIASAGVLRLANAESISWRNAANGANLSLTASASDRLTFGGVNVPTISSTDILTNKTLTSPTITGTGAIAGTFTGNLTGDVTGNVSGTSGSTTGNAATATALQTARNINGTSFNGTANITVTAAAGTLTGATLASGVTASSLTSFGTSPTLVTPVLGVAAATSLSLSGATATTVPYLDGSKILTSSAVTPTELGYLSGVTSAIQTQMNLKAPLASPSFTTPTLGVATATSINKMAITAPATSSTLAVADGKTLTASNTMTLSANDGAAVVFGNGGTVLYSGGALGTPLSGTLTNATGLPIAGITGLGTNVATALAATLNGSGALAATTSPAFVTPTLGVASATDLAVTAGTAGNGKLWFASNQLRVRGGTSGVRFDNTSGTAIASSNDVGAWSFTATTGTHTFTSQLDTYAVFQGPASGTGAAGLTITGRNGGVGASSLITGASDGTLSVYANSTLNLYTNHGTSDVLGLSLSTTGVCTLGPTAATNSPHLIYGGQTQKQVTTKAEAAVILFEEKDTSPASPATGTEIKVYMKTDKLVFQYNDAGTVRYKYLDMTGTGVTWVHSTSAP